MDSDFYYVFNPNFFSAEAENIGNDWAIITQDTDLNNQTLLTRFKPKISGISIGLFGITTDMEKEYVSISATTTLKIRGNNTGDLPQKSWKILSGIFSIDTPDELPEIDNNDDELTESNTHNNEPDNSRKDTNPPNDEGLAPAAVGIITFICVVVVGVSVFCIIWFLVCKKPCTIKIIYKDKDFNTMNDVEPALCC